MQTYSSLIRHSGNAGLFTAVEMSIVSALAGHPLHLHAEGLRGTGKTTILRAARDTLPRIERIRGCVYNCRPDHPHCPNHRSMDPEAIEALGTESVPMPFFEISHSAKVGTVVGSIDLAALTDRAKPVAALLPGTLPRAHRGIIFVDEINRLADTSPDLADVLLDVMGTKPGRVQIEETGLPVIELPVEVTVWAASNPDEDPGPLADIRRQLSDRFDLTVNMVRPSRSDVVTRILDLADGRAKTSADTARERLAETYHGFTEAHQASDVRAASGIAAAVAPGLPESPAAELSLPNAAQRLVTIQWPSATRLILADLYVDFGLESLRAVEAMQQAATLRCALEGRSEVCIPDLIAVAGFALRHRVDLALLARITAYLQGLEAKTAAALQAGLEGALPLMQPSQPEPTQPPPQMRQAGGSGAPTGPQPTQATTPASPASTQLSPAVGPGTLTQPSQPAAHERGGFGRLLARFLGGNGGAAPPGAADPGGPYPNACATGGQGRTDRGNQASGTGVPGSAGAPPTEVTAPPRRARSIFDLVPEDVITMPEDIRRV